MVKGTTTATEPHSPYDYQAGKKGLVLSRKKDEAILLDDVYTCDGELLPAICIIINEVASRHVRLIVKAHESVTVAAYEGDVFAEMRNSDEHVATLGVNVQVNHNGLFIGDLFNAHGEPVACGVHVPAVSFKQSRVKLVADREISIIREELLRDDG